jgi:hypothetical protein
MASRSKRPQAPANTYHSVPGGWRVHELVGRYKTLRGPLAAPISSDISPAEPDLTPGQRIWVGYSRAFGWVADGISKHDPACVELAISYIIMDHYGSGSGYARSRFARRLKHAELDKSQRMRLCAHFERLCETRTRRYEFRQYCTLWQQIVPLAKWRALESIFPFLNRQSPAYLG